MLTVSLNWRPSVKHNHSQKVDINNHGAHYVHLNAM